MEIPFVDLKAQLSPSEESNIVKKMQKSSRHMGK